MQDLDQTAVTTMRHPKDGDQVIVPPPATAEAAEARLSEGYDCVDWYFCKKSL